MIDGQDSNDPSVTGRQQPINNTDIVQEIRLITNQFAAEFGRAAGSVMNVDHQERHQRLPRVGVHLPQRQRAELAQNNLDKAAGRTESPYRVENQFGGTLGGPVLPDRTFFFGSFQRWTDRRLGSGFTLNGAPSEAGRAGAAVGRRQPAARAGTAEAPAGGRAERPVGHVHARRPDLHGAARIVDRDRPRCG